MKRKHQSDSTEATSFNQTNSEAPFDERVNINNSSEVKEPIAPIKVDVKDELKEKLKDEFKKKENDELNNKNNDSCSANIAMNNSFNGIRFYIYKNMTKSINAYK